MSYILRAALLLSSTAMPAALSASVIYSGLVNEPLSTGVATHLNIEGREPLGFAIGVFFGQFPPPQLGVQILFGGPGGFPVIAGVVASAGQPRALDNGAAIDASLEYRFAGAVVTMAATQPCNAGALCFPAGQFVNTNGKFLGFQFVALDGQTHFGWARFNIAQTPGPSITGMLIDYAWQDTAQTAITAGDTGQGTVPEPGTAVLAAAALMSIAAAKFADRRA